MMGGNKHLFVLCGVKIHYIMRGLLKVGFIFLGYILYYFGMGGDKHLFVFCGVKVHYKGAVLNKKMYFFLGTLCIILGVVFKKKSFNV